MYNLYNVNQLINFDFWKTVLIQRKCNVEGYCFSEEKWFKFLNFVIKG